jgi:hypothetical protein
MRALAIAQLPYTNCKDNCDANVTNITKVSGTFVLLHNAIMLESIPTLGLYDCGNISDKFIQVIIIQDTTVLFGLLYLQL